VGASATGNPAGEQGLGVSPRGHVVFGSLFSPPLAASRKIKYKLPVLPGRFSVSVLWVFDKDGKRVIEDGFPGASWLAGVKMDRDGYVYAQMQGYPLFNGKVGAPMRNSKSCTLVKFKPGEARMFSDMKPTDPGLSKHPLPKDQVPARPKEFSTGKRSGWLEGMAWMVPDVGISGNKATKSSSNCICACESRFDLDLYSRSFCSEVHKYRVCVVDSNGNPMLNIGRLGNVDSGQPLAKNDRVPNPRKIGGDEVAIAHCTAVAVHSDKRLFISDIGNTCVRSVKLDYHASETVPLR
jgi:hypothetical protein